ncbi:MULTISPECIES: glucuronate isomerase [unclassified Roseitalea]|uniref:glucuronate isomerase n=1 Tax=unclassified Roseitalea TaxID=2639107 RepID=UPI00273E4D32|nr:MULTISPECIES: glucuronate isomerase [unclassified Roseitalea]
MAALNHPDRLLPADPGVRAIARRLYDHVAGLPIVSPHGHCDPAWFADNAPFPDPARLLIVPDHYIFRMLHSQGVALESLGIARRDGGPVETDPRAIWRVFAAHYHLFAGTPTRLWLDHTFETLFGLTEPLGPDNAEACYAAIDARLKTDAYRPRALFERFGIEVLATTEGALDDLRRHRAIAASGWPGRVVTTYRPDALIDPDHEDFAANLDAFGAVTGCDIGTWAGYLDAHRARRAYFRDHGATATDHGLASARTANLARAECEAIFDRLRSGRADKGDAALFRAQMLTEMAKMSVEDGMVMQIHPGSWRDHSAHIFKAFGRDKGFDIPMPTDYVGALKPMLDAVGHAPGLTVIVFTLDETAYGRELAPMAGVYPCLKLGPAWWFFDSPDGIRRFRELTTETAGLYNTVGFNDDTRAFPSIPARHDMARRIDCAFLAERVADHRLREDEAFALAEDLTVNLARRAYGFDR